MATITIGQITLEQDGYGNQERYIVKESPYSASLDNEINQWLWDGCWDLFSGYENETYYQELVAFQHEAERMFSRASGLGCRGNLLLVAHIESMEKRLQWLENEFDYHRSNISEWSHVYKEI